MSWGDHARVVRTSLTDVRQVDVVVASISGPVLVLLMSVLENETEQGETTSTP